MKKTLADRLAFLISSLGISQQDFARRIQYSPAYVSIVLSGAKQEAGHRFIGAVCREFNVNPEWLGKGKEPVFSVPALNLPPDRAEVLAKLNMLSDDKRKLIIDIIDAFLVNGTENQPSQKPDGV
jgi:transcriptional regulator with XRE-family HTH domain